MKKITDFTQKQFLWVLIVLNLLLKLPFLFIDVNPSDVYFYYTTGWFHLNDVLPYSSFELTNLSHFLIYMNSVHPNGAFNYLYYAAIVYLFGDSIFSIKFTWLIAEIIISIYIYKIALLFTTIQKASIAGLLYTICIPSYYPGILVGCDELITSAFAIMGIYYFFCRRPMLAGFLLSLGFAYKMYPLFLFPPIFMYAFANRRRKEFFIVLISFIITYGTIIFPYLILDPESFIYWTFGQSSRLISISYGEYFSDSWFYSPFITISVVNILISPYFLLQIGIMGGYFLYDLNNWRKTGLYQEFSFFKAATFYIAILPVVSMSYNYRYFQWLLPMLLLYLVLDRNIRFNTNNRIQVQDSNPNMLLVKIGLRSMILNYIITIIALIQLYNENYSWFPLGIHRYNNYIISFAIVFSYFLLEMWRNFRDSPFIQYYNFVGFFQGLTGLTLYFSFAGRAFHNQFEIPFLYISIITLCISFGFIMHALFWLKKKQND
jgi:uncharacterized membrane protein